MLFGRKNFVFSLICVLVLFSSCKKGADKPAEQTDEPIVQVFGETLYKSDVMEALPKGLSKNDSILTAKAFEEKWIREHLVYEIAKKNISDKDKIDEMVENYRHTLITYTYQEELLKEHLSQKISEDELRKYYDANKNKLALTANLVKGIYLKVPLNAPQKDELLKRYKSNSDEAKEYIEKYSLRNAVGYDYFYDNWKNFAEIASVLPGSINDSPQFLTTHKTYQAQDSLYVYLLNIHEYKLAGSIPPFEYAKAQITDLILNQRKDAFIHKFEDDIYRKAVGDKDVKFFTNKN